PQYGYQQAQQQPPAPQPAGLQQTPAPYIPQQTAAPRGYPGPQQYQQPRPGAASANPAGFDAMRPVAPRPAAPASYEDPYNRQHPNQGGY
ncbi:DUF6643 family protein, partial [Streptomyces sp. UNOC14_S4]|uniref:DUF6643 family protein n=1 Tax=Streptomyces sp. UNOC14_S4 TaxID=2872340 RepID=UPI0035AF35C0|nr:hypothetical protein [Streptomyces sp. UNOC14_S4]